MTPTDLRAAFLTNLIAVAPDLDPATIGEDDHMQDDLGLDSMKFMHLISALHGRFGLPIPLGCLRTARHSGKSRHLP